MIASHEAARRRRLALILMSPLIIGIGVQWQDQLWPALYHAIPYGKIPLPTDIGVYGIKNGELHRFTSGTKQIPSFEDRVEFVVHRNESIPEGVWSVVEFPLLPQAKMPEGEANSMEVWLEEVKNFHGYANSLLTSPLPDNLVVHPCKVTSIPGFPLINRVSPPEPLQPGMYVLFSPGPVFTQFFFVDLEEIQLESRAAIRNAITKNDWGNAFREALKATVLGISDIQFQKDADEIRFRSALEIARETYKTGETRILEQALVVASSIRKNDPQLRNLQQELMAQKEAEVAASRQATQEAAQEAAQERQEPPVASPVGTKITPVDEGEKDTSFSAFRAGLVQTLEKKNAPGLLAIVAEDVANPEDVGNGKGTFIDFWQPDKPTSEIWWQLAGVLKHGGRFSEDESTFTAPFVYTDFREQAKTHQEIGVVVGTDVSVRMEPRTKAPLLVRLTFEVVQLQFGESPTVQDAEGGEYPWYHVVLPNSMQGYTSSRYLRCPLDYHAVFTKKGNGWVMSEFRHDWPARH